MGEILKSKPYGVMFHHFHNGHHRQSQGSITDDQLDEIIQKIGRKKIINADEWVDKITNKCLQNSDVCITFDDSLLCQYDIAYPVLESYGIKAFWFIYSSPFSKDKINFEVNRYFRENNFRSISEYYEIFINQLNDYQLNDKQISILSSFDPKKYLIDFRFYSDEDKKYRFIRDNVLSRDEYFKLIGKIMEYRDFNYLEVFKMLWMKKEHLLNLIQNHHIIGMHSHNHPMKIENLSYNDQLKEYGKNYDFIYKTTGIKPISMSHPCNSYSTDTLNILNDMKIKIGFRSNMKNIPFRNPNLELPRYDHVDFLKT